MRLYQLHRTHSAGESAGYEYFSSRAEAQKAASQWLRSDDSLLEHGVEVKQIDVDTNKKGLLRALNLFASHSDNG